MPETIPLAVVNLPEETVDAVSRVLRSGQLRGGRLVERFENSFAEMVGAAEAVAVSSGTMALLLSCLALLKPGDEVLLPAFTHISTAAMVKLAGATPVLCDIQPDTWTLDPADIERKITDRSRAIVCVHLYGNAGPMDAISRIAAAHDLRLIGDACQAHLTRYGKIDVGAWGDLACYSFYPTKAMTTGEGGMITTHSSYLAERLRRLRNQGQVRKYFHDELGLNGRMTEIGAAIGLAELQYLPQRIEKRRQNARRLHRAIDTIPGLKRQRIQPGSIHSYHQYAIRVDPAQIPLSREEIMIRFKKRGIETAIHYPIPVHKQPFWAGERDPGPLPEAESLASEVFSIPVHQALDEDQLRRITAAISCLKKRCEK